MFCQAGRRPSLDFNSETTYVSVHGKPIVSGKESIVYVLLGISPASKVVWKPLPVALPAACERKEHGI
jgi:hypothetical protein